MRVLNIKYDIVFTMDADLQDDPIEIPRFLEEIQNGYDLVTGWKENRLDPKEKQFLLNSFNAMTSKMSGLKPMTTTADLSVIKKRF